MNTPIQPLRGTATVRVLHNNSPQAQLYGYTLLDTLTCVYAYDDPDLHPETREIEVAERAYNIFTVGHTPAYGTPDPRAAAYREQGNRSLSVGDVVCVDGRFLACEPFGWNEIDPPRESPQSVREPTPHA
ncbi:hypothetical protein [Saccharopolyspora endophytica]|uniref:Uncharacterized protein n=1 Tax=Saccharopolyspora endophytica TaxID=543886 RepID=A0ABS5DQQ5_9PSEU|nr:hypothetical protein [Saccharopolyspora endophytica]MBQ0928593.1 hypothetical protein [Saccharopolyspora endophytica]